MSALALSDLLHAVIPQGVGYDSLLLTVSLQGCQQPGKAREKL